MFGLMPANGFFIRHARGIDLSNVSLSNLKPDSRPALVFESVKDILLERVNSEKAAGVPTLILKNADNITIQRSAHLPDGTIGRADRKDM
jgi:hypothetical protein